MFQFTQVMLIGRKLFLQFPSYGAARSIRGLLIALIFLFLFLSFSRAEMSGKGDVPGLGWAGGSWGGGDLVRVGPVEGAIASRWGMGFTIISKQAVVATMCKSATNNPYLLRARSVFS